jgi:hypothetical protein
MTDFTMYVPTVSSGHFERCKERSTAPESTIHFTDYNDAGRRSREFILSKLDRLKKKGTELKLLPSGVHVKAINRGRGLDCKKI